MKILLIASSQLKHENRWDIDYHLPPTGIWRYPKEILIPVAECATIVKTKKDPTKTPDEQFMYIDIASIDVETGTISRPQELIGEEAPSRARKLVSAYDIIISTVRPTRGAIAVVPEYLHGQICSTGFSVIRAKPNVNPFYLHFALRLPSTLEQFKKWSTGSSYPAILDPDVAKTLIPLPAAAIQDAIAGELRTALFKREKIFRSGNRLWKMTNDAIINRLSLNATKDMEEQPSIDDETDEFIFFTISDIQKRLGTLPTITEQIETGEDNLIQLDLGWHE